MSQDGKYSGSVESFNDQFFQSGKRGYEFRYGIYKQFKDAGADVGKDYHDFSLACMPQVLRHRQAAFMIE